MLSYAYEVNPKLMYNEVSELHFNLPKMVDGQKTPLYDQVVGRMMVELQGVGRFLLFNPQEGDGVKQCTAYSLEYEFSQKKITVPEGTYKFYDMENPDGTLLGMLLEDLPSWSVASVPETIANRYRTFEVSGENRYNFIKSTVQKTYRCIFNFDTFTRTIYIDDADRVPTNEPVFLSSKNLARTINITEQTEDIVTRLDVNGAEGVSIRDVNPNGSNKIICLDYYMTPEHFSQALIDKYYAWKELNTNNRDAYYHLSVRYTLAQERSATASAELVDLQGELTSLDNLRAVTIQAISQNLKKQEDLDKLNKDMDAKKAEIAAQEETIASIKAEIETIFSQMKQITEACSFSGYFTKSELAQLDKYLIDDSVQESSFAPATVAFAPTANGSLGECTGFNVDTSEVESIDPVGGGTIYRIRGGCITDSNGNKADVISGEAEKAATGMVTCSFYLSNAKYNGETYPQACMTFVCNEGTFVASGDKKTLAFSAGNVQQYFTLNVSEYEKRSIAWELFEYGESILEKLSKPTYQFDLDSANFLAIEAFSSFKESIELGECVYLELSEGNVITPVCIGVSFTYSEPESLELTFSDKYVSGDTGDTLVDLLEQSVSMGKTVSSNQFIYSEYASSGAGTAIGNFMTSAMDVSKNAIFSSSGNAATMDGSGFHLRRWVDSSQTSYDPEEIWMVNNSIVMTDDGWKTAKMAIGKFTDPNLGVCWGVVAPMVVGTMLAGSKLVIESEKKDGNTAVFRVDENGAKLYNSNFVIASENRSVLMDADVGIAIGPLGFYSVDDKGKYTIDKAKANFYVDEQGNIFLRGAVTATELHIGEQTIEEFVEASAGGTKTFVQPEAPTDGYSKGDLWRDSDSPYGYLYVAVGTSGKSAEDWDLIAVQSMKGAAISTNAESGTIDIAAASTLNIVSGKQLTIAGGGGIALNAGELTLGSAANKLTSSGVLSLASGSILLDGPNNAVTIGKAGGVVNIGTDGLGVINLATYNVKSDTKSVSYSGTFSAGGASSAVDTNYTIEYTATSESSGGETSTATITISSSYSGAAKSTQALPSMASGKLLQLVYGDKGINVYASTDSSEMILAPSVSAGHLMGWEMVSAQKVAAANISASTMISSSMYMPDPDDVSKLVSVADQKWTINKIASILNAPDVLPSIKKKVDSAYWRAYYHSHKVSVNEDGTITLGEVSSTGGSFNIADTAFYKDGVSAAVTAYKTNLGVWGVGRSSGTTFTVYAGNKNTRVGDASTGGYLELTASAKLVKVFIGNANIASCDVSEVYDGGVTAGIETGRIQYQPSSVSALTKTYARPHSYTLSFGIMNAAGEQLMVYSGVEVDARDAFDDGYDDGYKAGYEAALDGVWCQASYGVAGDNVTVVARAFDKDGNQIDYDSDSFQI